MLERIVSVLAAFSLTAALISCGKDEENQKTLLLLEQASVYSIPQQITSPLPQNFSVLPPQNKHINPSLEALRSRWFKEHCIYEGCFLEADVKAERSFHKNEPDINSKNLYLHDSKKPQDNMFFDDGVCEAYYKYVCRHSSENLIYFRCVPYLLPEHCNSRDDDCNNKIDEEGVCDITPLYSIQRAIDTASSDSLVLVPPGEYFENIIIKKPVAVACAEPLACTINGKGKHSVVTFYNAHASLKDFIITNGVNNYGGGIHIINSDTFISGCLVYNNHAIGTLAHGGGLAVESGQNNVVVINSTFAGNHSDHQGSAVSLDIHGAPHNNVSFFNCIFAENECLYSAVQSTTTRHSLEYSDVCCNHSQFYDDERKDLMTITIGEGSFQADPLFVDSAGGDYHLIADSPCRNAGTDVGLPFNGTAPDMGAYEYVE